MSLRYVIKVNFLSNFTYMVNCISCIHTVFILYTWYTVCRTTAVTLDFLFRNVLQIQKIVYMKIARCRGAHILTKTNLFYSIIFRNDNQDRLFKWNYIYIFLQIFRYRQCFSERIHYVLNRFQLVFKILSLQVY